MGQKVHPYGIRIGIVKSWNSIWYTDKKHFSEYVYLDFKIRNLLINKLTNACVSRILIERTYNNQIYVSIYTARPVIFIEKKGLDTESLSKYLKKFTGLKIYINVVEVRQPELDAKLLADSITSQLEHRVHFRIAMRRAISNAMRFGAIGIKVEVNGRLNGAEIARTEWYREGRVPLHTLRADIDYNTSEAKTTYGVIGVKVWIFKGEIL